MKEVSIVIPVYNVSEYIERCWRSVDSQTYPNIELIFVDDCGSDDSITKLENLIEQGHRFPVRILKHERNRGLSAARNTGIRAAEGEYIYFLDSDDDIVPTCIEELVAPLLEKDYDFVIGDYSIHGSKEMESAPLQSGGLLGNEAVIRAYAEGKWFVMAWNKLLKKSFVEDNELFFKEGIIHEDVLWSFKLACAAKSMFSVPVRLYNYYVRRSSIMTSMSIEKDLSAYIGVFDDICDYVRVTGRQYGRWEYAMIEGKKCGIMYSLLHLRENDLFRRAYHFFRLQANINPLIAFRKGIINWGTLIRDLHYILPESLGCLYKSTFYIIVYRLFNRPLTGIVWKKYE